MRVNLRLNPKKDKDIIDALSNVLNITKEAKKLLRLGMCNTGLAFQGYIIPEIDHKDEIIDINQDSLESLKENLMSNDFGF